MTDEDADLPEAIVEALPHGRRLEKATLLEMAYTACMVRKEGDAFEFRLKIHPEQHRVPFLEQDDPLNGCYQLLKKDEGGILKEVLDKYVQNSAKNLFLDTPSCAVEEKASTSSQAHSQARAKLNKKVPQTQSTCAIVHGYSDSE